MGGGVNAAGGDVEQDSRLRPPPREHREAAVVGALGRGCDDAARDLALEHERQPVIERRPRLRLEPAGEQRGCDVIGQVGRDPQGRAAGLLGQRRRRDVKRVALDDLESARPVRAYFGQRAERARITLDRDHLPRPLREKRARQPAGAGSDLDHGDAFERPGRPGDSAGQVEIEQEVLTERLAGLKPVRGRHLAQRRQSVHGEAHWVNRSASFSAAMRLAGLAKPRPAMSNAVPWSGEVRTNGRPRVTLTPSSKASVLTGMRPWS